MANAYFYLTRPMCNVISYQISSPHQRQRYNVNFLAWLESRIYNARTGDLERKTIYLKSLSRPFIRQLYKLLSYGGRLNMHLERRRKIVERFVRGSHPLDRLARCAE